MFALSLYGCGADDSDDSSDEMNNAGTMTGCSTVHTVTTTDETADPDLYMDFSPENLTISAGDCVNFVMSNTHNAIEVSQETFDSRGTQALDDGFQVGFGETKEVRFDEPGTHYYICLPHVRMDMIGTITVE